MAIDIFLNNLNEGLRDSKSGDSASTVDDGGTWIGIEHEVPADHPVVTVVEVGEEGAEKTAWQVRRAGSRRLHVVPTQEDAVRLAAELAIETGEVEGSR